MKIGTFMYMKINKFLYMKLHDFCEWNLGTSYCMKKCTYHCMWIPLPSIYLSTYASLYLRISRATPSAGDSPSLLCTLLAKSCTKVWKILVCHDSSLVQAYELSVYNCTRFHHLKSIIHRQQDHSDNWNLNQKTQTLSLEAMYLLKWRISEKEINSSSICNIHAGKSQKQCFSLSGPASDNATYVCLSRK